MMTKTPKSAFEMFNVCVFSEKFDEIAVLSDFLFFSDSSRCLSFDVELLREKKIFCSRKFFLFIM